jgi:hypothetical protein
MPDATSVPDIFFFSDETVTYAKGPEDHPHVIRLDDADRAYFTETLAGLRVFGAHGRA